MSTMFFPNRLFPVNFGVFFFGFCAPPLFVYFGCMSLGMERPQAAFLALLSFLTITIGVGCVVFRDRQRQRKAESTSTDGSSDLWGNGTTLFAEEWMLDLSVKVPVITISETSMLRLREQLRHYFETAKTATAYFPDGIYLIGRDGSMRKLDDAQIRNQITKLSGCMQVKASIDFEELPYFDTIEHRLANSTPSSLMEKSQNCVLLYIHAHGTIQGNDKEARHCMVRFATRDGKVIAESLT